MVLFLALSLVIVLATLIGFLAGYLRASFLTHQFSEKKEEYTYCEGWQDGLWYALGEYKPELYKKEKALQSFREFKCGSTFKEQ